MTEMLVLSHKVFSKPVFQTPRPMWKKEGLEILKRMHTASDSLLVTVMDGRQKRVCVPIYQHANIRHVRNRLSHK